MMLYGILIAVTVPILVGVFYRPPPDANTASAVVSSARYRPVAGLPPNLVLAILAAAIFCCCMTMSIPLAHVVAFCGDMGVGARAGAAMLSVQLGAGVFAQQIWGWIADRLGGLRTILFASASMVL